MSTAATLVAVLLVASTPGDLADPRPAHHVVDLTGTLGPADIAAIDAEAARGAAGGEILVAVVPSTDGMNPRAFTTAVFNRLGVDGQARNRGVVLLAAIGDRKAEIVVGDGFPAGVTNETDAIMSGVVVARFKAGDPRGALVQGARALVDRVLLRDAPAATGGAATRTEPEPADAAASRQIAREVLAAIDDPVVQSVPDPRERGGVVDGARLLSKKQLAELRGMREGQGGGDILVVTASATGGLSTSVFARALFERLHEARAAPRAALLVVVARPATADAGDAPPVAELVLGADYPRELAEATATRVSAAWSLRASANPKERGAATIEAARSLSALDAELARWQAEQARIREEERLARMAMAAERAQSAAKELSDNPGGGRGLRAPDALPGGPYGFAGMALAVIGGGVGVREIVRRWPRKCARCHVRMERLGEEVDDRHLSSGEKAEERLGSVDYDIWCCPECGDMKKLRWGALITRFSSCPSCNFRTRSSTSRTINAATQYSSGLAEITERCGHCDYARTYTRTIPRLPKPSTSSSSSRSSSSGSRGSSSGRGSSGSW
ncbi:MAG: TPM domain-containing protein [Deltaproteobacteria bacterium]|nr:TPM domain-containing protein [Deltaproteobacteria bacterium]